MTAPLWLELARKHLGTTEIPGRATHPKIRRWLIDLRAWWTDDETPWCGTFVAAMMKEAGQPLPRHWYRARAWLEWGQPLTGPALGAIVVYARGGGGHVNFAVGLDTRGRVMGLGGNQGNAVSVAPFDRSRVLGYRWPMNVPLPAPWGLPVIETGARSSNEEG